jgi:HTH-type transcriptional regulator / antitoxin HipB
VVRFRRKRLRLTQKQLAELAGCGPDFMYDLERGKPTVQLGKLVAVLQALGLKLEVTPEQRSVGLGTGTPSGDWISGSLGPK